MRLRPSLRYINHWKISSSGYGGAAWSGEDLRRVASQYATDASRVVVVVGDGAKLLPAMREAGLTNIVARPLQVSHYAPHEEGVPTAPIR
jgi:hypothetical protein